MAMKLVRPIFRPYLEPLEDRWNPSSFTVNDPLDLGQLNSGTNDPTDLNGTVSLRSAIAAANVDASNGNSDSITFAASLNGSTLTLIQGQLELEGNGGTITIDGGGQITVSGNKASGVFLIDYGANAFLGGLTVEGGNSEVGGGIYNSGVLTVNSSTFSGNTATYPGGGIYNSGTLTVSGTTLTGNTAGAGGGIDNDGGTLTVSDCTLSGNSAQTGGGIDSERSTA
jgi:predicted outer membrane repeat protein